MITQDPYPPLNDSPNLFDQLNSFLLTTMESNDNHAPMIMAPMIDESIPTTTDDLLSQFALEHDQQMQFNGDDLKKEYLS
jgi:hypothetical protein